MGVKFGFVNYMRSCLVNTIAFSAVCLNCTLPSAATADTDLQHRGRLYTGLTFNPSYSSIQNFRLKNAGQYPAGILAYHSGIGTVSERFDWDKLDTRVEFESSSFPAISGVVGLNIQDFRVELEVGRAVFPIKTSEVGGTGTFLLIRDFAHAIAQRDAGAIESALLQHMGDDTQKIKSVLAGIEEIELALTAGVEQRFVDIMRSMQKDPKAEFPRSAVKHLVAGYGAGKYKYSSKLVAKKIAGLSTQGIVSVASSFIKNVEGATVVRISGITSTSATLNICRDVPAYTPDVRLIPYACAGVGWGIIGMSGDTTTRLLYKVKGGARYVLTPRIHITAGAFLQGVFGDVRHKNLETEAVAGNRAASSSDASATFRLKNLGLNIGASFAI